MGCGRAADQPRTGGPCKPQIATDSYSIQTRKGHRPGLGFDDACVLLLSNCLWRSEKLTKLIQRLEGMQERWSSQGLTESGSVHVALSRTILGMARGLFHRGLREALYILQSQGSLIKAFHLYG